MAETPLIFSAPMVRALLAEQKTQTRRLVTRHNSLVNGSPASRLWWEKLDFSRGWVDPGPSPAGNPGPYLKIGGPDDTYHRVYPRMSVGDCIWCRESFGIVYDCPPACGGWEGEHGGFCEHRRAVYRATDAEGLSGYCDREKQDDYGRPAPLGWTSPIFLRRRDCRITLPVVAVRAERVCDISHADALAEGCESIGAYATAWNDINAERAPWASNPWVYVSSFMPPTKVQ